MASNRPFKLILPFHTLETLRVRISWFVNLRWIAIMGLLGVVPITEQMLQFRLAYPQIYTLIALWTILNLLYFFLCKYLHFEDFSQEIIFTEVQVVLDFILISFLIHYTGGIGNPFYFLYIVHIIISGILFEGSWPYLNATLAAFLMTFWSVLEYHGVVTVYSLNNAIVSPKVYIVSLAAFYLLIYTSTYVIRDIISGYRLLKRVIDQKSELLEQTIAERDKIFRFTAHELKSPLTTLRSMLAVIEEVYGETLQPAIKDMVERAVRRTDQVLLMVKDMIEVTQYKQGIARQMIMRVNYRDWLSKVIEQQKPLADNKKITLSLAPLNPDLTVEMDTIAMEKVLSNLINNAIRYSLAGATVSVNAFVKQKIFGFAVSDTGIGIAPDDLLKIFDEFYRGANAREIESLGTGLGLSLVKQIVEQNGGRIYVESQLGVGSTFTVELPLVESLDTSE